LEIQGLWGSRSFESGEINKTSSSRGFLWGFLGNRRFPKRKRKREKEFAYSISYWIYIFYISKYIARSNTKQLNYRSIISRVSDFFTGKMRRIFVKKRETSINLRTENSAELQLDLCPRLSPGNYKLI